jgi:hypothetical protein
MGFQVVVMFIDSFLDDVAYVRDVEVYVKRTTPYNQTTNQSSLFYNGAIRQRCRHF